MHLFNENGSIEKFNDINDILRKWYENRLDKYKLRKIYLIGKLENELDLLKYRAMFIQYVIEEKIKVLKENVNQLLKILKNTSFLN